MRARCEVRRGDFVNMSKRELLVSKDTKTRNCIKTGCKESAVGNVDPQTKKFTTKELTRKNFREFCAEHGKELEEQYKKYEN